MAEWKTVLLGDICKTNTTSYSNKDGWKFVNYLDTGNITVNDIDVIQYIDLQEEKLPSRAKRKVKYNSILYSTVRPNQLHYGIIKDQPENFLVSTGFTVIDVDPSLADADYIYYWLTQSALTEKLHSIAEQSVSAYPSIKASDIEALEIELPPLEEQKRIAEILTSLDKKRKNNTAINRNLSEQQDVLYKLYFKDCEGEIKKVKDVVSFSQGVQVPVEEQLLVKEDGYEQFIRIVDVAQNNTDIRFVKDTNRGKITEYDVFMVRYGSQTAGMIARGKRGIIANNLFTINSDELSEEYLFCYFGSDTVKNYLKGNSTSSTMPAINFGTLNAMDILIPSKTKMDEFTVVARSLFEKKLLVEKEIEKLTKLRESLLPKLMSGELDVSDLDI